jgi:DNA primase
LDFVRDSVAKSRQVVVVEGYTDAIVAAQAGLENVTAVLGTALGPRHIRLLRRFADTITLVLDGDEAGQKRTNEILELFVAEHVDLRILTLPDGLDPCDFVLQRGGDAFRQLLAGAVDALEHELRIATRGIDPTTETHRAHQALENVLATVAKAPRLQSGTTTSMRLREQQILARLAREFRIAESDLRARLNDLRRRTKAPQRAPEKVASPAVSISSLNPKESELIEILALHGELVARAISEISPDQLSPGPLRVIYETYGRCCATIDAPQFNQVLTELEDPRLKNLLVQLDERAQAKESQAHEAAPLRLQRLIVDFRRGQEVKQIRHQVAQLEAGKFDEQEELKVLLELHEREKRRQTELNGG